MATTYVLISIAVLVLLWLIRVSMQGDKQPEKPVRGDELEVWPFEPLPFMTPAEVRFFSQLQEALPEYYIFAQVQLSRLIQCNDPEDEKFWLNRINRMSADYVVVHPDVQSVMAVVELDDWSHDRADRRRADDKKDKAILSAGLPMVRFHTDHLPDTLQVRFEILDAMEDMAVTH